MSINMDMPIFPKDSQSTTTLTQDQANRPTGAGKDLVVDIPVPDPPVDELVGNGEVENESTKQSSTNFDTSRLVEGDGGRPPDDKEKMFNMMEKEDEKEELGVPTVPSPGKPAVATGGPVSDMYSHSSKELDDEMEDMVGGHAPDSHPPVGHGAESVAPGEYTPAGSDVEDERVVLRPSIIAALDFLSLGEYVTNPNTPTMPFEPNARTVSELLQFRTLMNGITHKNVDKTVSFLKGFKYNNVGTEISIGTLQQQFQNSYEALKQNTDIKRWLMAWFKMLERSLDPTDRRSGSGTGTNWLSYGLKGLIQGNTLGTDTTWLDEGWAKDYLHLGTDPFYSDSGKPNLLAALLINMCGFETTQVTQFSKTRCVTQLLYDLKFACNNFSPSLVGFNNESGWRSEYPNASYDVHFNLNTKVVNASINQPTILNDCSYRKSGGDLPQDVSSPGGFYEMRNDIVYAASVSGAGVANTIKQTTNQMKITAMLLSREFAVSAGLARLTNTESSDGNFHRRKMLDTPDPFRRLLGDVSVDNQFVTNDQNLSLKNVFYPGPVDADFVAGVTPVTSPPVVRWTSKAETGNAMNPLNNMLPTEDFSTQPRTIFGHGLLSDVSSIVVKDQNLFPGAAVGQGATGGSALPFEDRRTIGIPLKVGEISPGYDVFVKNMLAPDGDGPFLNFNILKSWAKSYKNTCLGVGDIVNKLLGYGIESDNGTAQAVGTNSPMDVQLTFLKHYSSFMATISTRVGWDEQEYTKPSSSIEEAPYMNPDYEVGDKDNPTTYKPYPGYSTEFIPKLYSGEDGGITLSNLVTLIIFKMAVQYDTAGFIDSPITAAADLSYKLWYAWRLATQIKRLKSLGGEDAIAGSVPLVNSAGDDIAPGSQFGMAASTLWHRDTPAINASNSKMKSMTLLGKYIKINQFGDWNASSYEEFDTPFLIGPSQTNYGDLDLAFHDLIREIIQIVTSMFMAQSLYSQGASTWYTGESKAVGAGYLSVATAWYTDGDEGGFEKKYDGSGTPAKPITSYGAIADMISLYNMFETGSTSSFDGNMSAFKQYLYGHLARGLGIAMLSEEYLNNPALGDYMLATLEDLEKKAGDVATVGGTYDQSYLTTFNNAQLTITAEDQAKMAGQAIKDADAANINDTVLKPKLTAFNGLDEDTLSFFVFHNWVTFLDRYPSGRFKAMSFQKGIDEGQDQWTGFDDSIVSENPLIDGEGEWDGYSANASGFSGWMIDPDQAGIELPSDNPNPSWETGGFAFDDSTSGEEGIYLGSVNTQGGAPYAVAFMVETNAELNRQLTLYLQLLYQFYSGTNLGTDDSAFPSWQKKFSSLYAMSTGTGVGANASKFGEWMGQALQSFETSSGFKLYTDFTPISGFSSEPHAWELTSLMQQIWATAGILGWDELEDVMVALRRESAFSKGALQFFSWNSAGIYETVSTFGSQVTDPAAVPQTLNNKSLYENLNAAQGSKVEGNASTELMLHQRSIFGNLTLEQLGVQAQRYRDFERAHYNGDIDNNNGVFMMPEHVSDFADSSPLVENTQRNLRVMKSVLGGEGSASIFSDAESKNLKVFFIGLPARLVETLRRYPLDVSPDGNGDVDDPLRRSTSSLIQIQIHRKDFSHPGLVFEPMTFLFDASMFIDSNDLPPGKAWSEWTMPGAGTAELVHLKPSLKSIVENCRFRKLRSPSFAKDVQLGTNADDWWESKKGVNKSNVFLGMYHPSTAAVGGAAGFEMPNIYPGWEDQESNIKSPYNLLNNDHIKAMCTNHVISETLMLYYRTLFGIHLDEQTFPVQRNWFTNHLNITNTARKFLQAAALSTKDDPSLTSTAGEPASTAPVITIGSKLLYNEPDPSFNLLHAEENEKIIPPLFLKTTGEFNNVGTTNERKLRRVKHTGVINKAAGLTLEKFENFRALLQSGLFQSTNLAIGAMSMKEFDRVFALPIDVDNFVVRGNTKEAEFYLELYEDILKVIDKDAEPEVYAQFPEGETLYQLSYSDIGPMQDFVFVDQFWAQVSLVETPGLGEDLTSFNHGKASDAA